MLHSKTLTSPPRSPMQTRPSHPRSTSILLTPSWNALLRIRSKIVPTKKPPWCIEPLCSANIAPHRKQRHPHAPLPMLLSSCRTMTFRCLLAQDLGDAGIALPRPTLRAACAPRAAFLAQPLLQRRPRLPRSAGARLASHGGRVTLSDCEPEKIVFALNTQRKHLHCPDSGHYVRPGPTQLLSCIRIMYMNFSRSRFLLFARALVCLSAR